MTDVKLSDIEMRVLGLIAVAADPTYEAVSNSFLGEFVVGGGAQGPLLAFRQTTLQLQKKQLVYLSEGSLSPGTTLSLTASGEVALAADH